MPDVDHFSLSDRPPRLTSSSTLPATRPHAEATPISELVRKMLLSAILWMPRCSTTIHLQWLKRKDGWRLVPAQCSCWLARFGDQRLALLSRSPRPHCCTAASRADGPMC